MSRFTTIDGCPVPNALAAAVLEVKRRTGQSLVTCYRGDDPEALAIMHAHGKHSQGELYAAWERGEAAAYGILGTPNRPGQSTHEQRSDGRAYPGPVGRKLADFECGMDWPDAAIPAVMRAFTAIGAVPVHPYTTGAEYHHINLRHPPVLFRTLKVGMRGPRVGIAMHRLAICGYFKRSGFYFSRHAEQVVRQFQRDHGLTPDGQIGPVTWRNIEAAARTAKAKRR